ncbi:MAG: SufE family protein [Alphaproteobacteria bacterium]|nr:SufE family protein [Alphaproteobacteria bacterium]
MDIEALVDDFGFFETWEERYRYLIDLGRDLPDLDEASKTEAHRVRGCISKVWVIPRVEAGPPKRLFFEADSDSSIVRGLVALAKAMFDGKTRDEIAAVDIDDVFARIGFDAHLSVNRRNGFQSMVKMIRAYADAM